MGDEGVLSRLARVCSAALGQDAGADLSFVNPVVYLNWHFYIELCFFVIILYLFTRSSYSPNRANDAMTPKEEQDMIDSWEPVPLAPELSEEETLLTERTVVRKQSGGRIMFEEDSREYLNFGSSSYLGLTGHPAVHAECTKAFAKYGVGSCGPRGFYGSIDVHIKCEEEIARFMGTEAAILYSYDAATVGSVIPAFCKSNDLIVCDEGVSYNIRYGLMLSRCPVMYFKHNDMAHLRDMLQGVKEEDKASEKRALNRRFIVFEGIYQNTGDIAPLDQLLALKDEFKFRLLADESSSVGVLGKTGRGLTEHFGIDVRKVDIICASLSQSFASIGGFSTGAFDIVDHQRLSGAGYCFSASLPPYLSQASIVALQLVDKEKDRLVSLRRNATRLRKGLRALCKKDNSVQFVGAADDSQLDSPLVHIGFGGAVNATHVRAVVEAAKAQGVVVVMPVYSPLDTMAPQRPSLRISTCSDHSEQDVDRLLEVLGAAVKHARVA